MNTHHEAMDDMAEFGSRLNTNEGGYRLDTRRPMHCTGPCDQGRSDCPCPADCQQPEPERKEGAGAVVVPILMVLAIVCVLGLWHLSGYLPGGW